uniref:Uncharacterized protein n=1 Tax=Nelumbo nucifera TaxID=4432 RepID=A0A822ZML1_NELNU|nr:TPA_asm: hypothetical protein HUJ06_002991 [Nelumbo nucifera]
MILQESESEEDGIDLGDDDVEEEHEEEHDHEPEVSVQAETVVKKPSQASVAPKEAERQLSKKELKKKGLEELDALLAELGIPKKDTPGPEESRGNLF